jgi:hypothetical protein
MRFFVFFACASLGFSTLASAEDCTRELLQEKTSTLFIYSQDHPEKAEKMPTYKAEIEAEYGGKPSEAQLCEVLDKVLAKMKADK